MSNTAELHDYHELTLNLQTGILNVGQSDDNELRLQDSAISPRHARIVTYFHQAFLFDLDSETGTYLNGRRIIKHSLKHGDVIQLGYHLLTVNLAGEDLADSESVLQQGQ